MAALRRSRRRLRGPLRQRAMRLRASVRRWTLPIQLGGGMRDVRRSRLAGGGHHARDPGHGGGARPRAGERGCAHFPGRIAVGIDARDGKVAVEGWAEVSELTAVELAAAIRGCGRRRHHFHRHRSRRHGAGVNVEATAALASAVRFRSSPRAGWVACATSKRLRRIPKIAGVVIGRALYDGELDAKAALTARGRSVHHTGYKT